MGDLLLLGTLGPHIQLQRGLTAGMLWGPFGQQCSLVVSHCPSLCSHTAEIVPLTDICGPEASQESPGPAQLWPLASSLLSAASRLPAGILGSRLSSTRTADRDRLPVITLPDLAATCRRVTLT